MGAFLCAHIFSFLFSPDTALDTQYDFDLLALPCEELRLSALFDTSAFAKLRFDALAVFHEPAQRKQVFEVAGTRRYRTYHGLMNRKIISICFPGSFFFVCADAETLANPRPGKLSIQDFPAFLGAFADTKQAREACVLVNKEYLLIAPTSSSSSSSSSSTSSSIDDSAVRKPAKARAASSVESQERHEAIELAAHMSPPQVVAVLHACLQASVS